MLSPTTPLLLERPPSSSCGIGGEEVWEVQVLPGPNAEPDYFTPAETSTFFFFVAQVGKMYGRCKRCQGPMLSPTTPPLLKPPPSSSCGTGGEEVWEVQALPEPNAEPDYSTPAETSTFFFLLHRWGRCMGGASAARAEC